MRILAAAAVLVTCGTMGLLVAASYGERVKNIRQLISFVQLLESEINYAQTPLPDVIQQEQEGYSGAVHQFLLKLNAELTSETGASFSSAWEIGLTTLEANGFPEEILRDLVNAGKVLGMSDASEQKKHLQILLTRLDENLEAAREEEVKQTKLWRFLGFAMGAVLVLLLF